MLRRGVARALERGTFGGPAALALAALWARAAEPARPLSLPHGVRVVGVGGATLGGSGKTPLVLALARALSRHRRVALVATAYATRARRARRVHPGDLVDVVGDEALWLARDLPAVPVFVGKSRSEALALAARDAELVIVDGLLQARPERLGCSLLVLDEHDPWGSGRCPPAGDLRAPPAELLARADAVVIPRAELLGARTHCGELLSLQALAGRRLGLLLAIARPDRVVRDLRAHGVEPRVVETRADHARFLEPRVSDVDAWLTTPKCATKLGPVHGGAPVWVLERKVFLPPALLALALGAA
jgi:tetraacyldisaccharide 4'-kinase